jgi:hypothetical protein
MQTKDFVAKFFNFLIQFTTIKRKVSREFKLEYASHFVSHALQIACQIESGHFVERSLLLHSIWHFIYYEHDRRVTHAIKGISPLFPNDCKSRWRSGRIRLLKSIDGTIDF